MIPNPLHRVASPRIGAPLAAWLLGCAVATVVAWLLLPSLLTAVWHQAFWVVLAVAASTLPGVLAGRRLEPAVPALVAAAVAWLVGTPATTPALMVLGLLVATGVVGALALAQAIPDARTSPACRHERGAVPRSETVNTP